MTRLLRKNTFQLILSFLPEADLLATKAVSKTFRAWTLDYIEQIKSKNKQSIYYARKHCLFISCMVLKNIRWYCASANLSIFFYILQNYPFAKKHIIEEAVVSGNLEITKRYKNSVNSCYLVKAACRTNNTKQLKEYFNKDYCHLVRRKAFTHGSIDCLLFLRNICSASKILDITDTREIIKNMQFSYSMIFKSRNFKLIEEALSLCDYENENHILYYPCKNADFRIINLAIERGADNWEAGLIAAATFDRLEVAKLMIENGAKDFSGALKIAEKEKAFSVAA